MAKYRAGETYNLPIFNCGIAWWEILDEKNNVVAIHMFSAADPTHKNYNNYMNKQKIRAERLPECLNVADENGTNPFVD